ncbi:MAG: GLUG motif-containing protein [Oscillospiraceae bacterium]
MKKRFLALLLVLTLVVGLMPAALAADTVDVAALPEYTPQMRTSAPARRTRSVRKRACGPSPLRSRRMTETAPYAHAGVTLYLAGDIALTGTWTPVGSTATYVGDFFAGTFDGCGHTISGLNVQSSTANQGLFAAINQATIRNLNVSGTVNSSTRDYVGGIVGKVQAGTIENCSFSGSVSSSKSKAYVGGIAGGLNSDERDDQRLRECSGRHRRLCRRHPWLLENGCDHSKLLQHRQYYRLGQGGRYCRPAEQGHY